MANQQSSGLVSMPDMYRVLYSNGESIDHTGTVSQTTIKSYTLSGGSLGIDGALRIRVSGQANLGVSIGTIRLKFGGTEVAAITFAITGVLKSWSYLLVCQNIGAEDSQIWSFLELFDTTISELNSKKTTAINTANNADFIVTAELDNIADHLYVGDVTIELRPTP